VNGKAVGLILVFSALLTGAAVWYLQVYGYYDPVPATAPAADIRLTSVVSGQPEKIAIAGFQGIDADSSPLRFRACFTTPVGIAMATESFEVYEAATPLNGPGWFDCFNAARIGGDLEAGRAVAFLSQADITPGIDRVVALYPDGRAFAWHQLNETAEK